MLIGMLIAVLITMRLFPETPTARALHEYLVEQPLAWVSRVDRRKLLYGAMLALLMFSFWEAIAVFGSMDLITVYAFDMALYLDAVIAIATISATTRVSVFRSYLRGRFARLFARRPASRTGTRPRQSRSTRSRLPANDNEAERRPWPTDNPSAQWPGRSIAI